MRSRLALCVALFSACSFGSATTVARAPASPTNVTPLAEEGKKDGKESGHEHKEGEHKHGQGEEEHKGEKKDLGSKKVGSFNVQVTQVGDVKSGEETILIIKPKGDGEPKAVRAWIGVESGQGSIKTKAEEEKEGEWHAHHKVSKPLPAKSKLWVELETAAGKQRASFDYKQ